MGRKTVGLFNTSACVHVCLNLSACAQMAAGALMSTALHQLSTFSSPCACECTNQSPRLTSKIRKTCLVTLQPSSPPSRQVPPPYCGEKSRVEVCLSYPPFTRAPMPRLSVSYCPVGVETFALFLCAPDSSSTRTPSAASASTDRVVNR